MTTYLGKSCSVGLLSVSFVNFYQFVSVLLSLLVLMAGEDLIVLIPDNCFFLCFQ